MATGEHTDGYVGNLTPKQEEKLRQLWMIILTAAETLPAGLLDPSVLSAAHAASDKNQKQQNQTPAPATTNGKTGASFDAKYGPLMATFESMGLSPSIMKSTEQILQSMAPEQLKMRLLSMVRHDHPDALLLRFLRARKWDVTKALAMMADAIEWRMEADVEGTIAQGELHALTQSRDSPDSSEGKIGRDFLAQMRMGKCYLRGVDKVGRPICVVKVRLHQPGAQSEEALEQYIVHVIESVRLMLADPVETAAVIFDMTEFSLKNVEFPPVKFIIKCFEANYPESLGVLLIHKAPWIFSGVWRLIKGWLDPVVASKIYFTNSMQDLEKYISRDQITKELGGDDTWEYQYAEPNLDENDKIKDTTSRADLFAEHERLGEELLGVTYSWVTAAATPDKAGFAACDAKRSALIKHLRTHYWKLDPYMRARTLWDRTGAIKNLYTPPSDERPESKEA